MFVENLNIDDIKSICNKVLGRVRPYLDEIPNSVNIDRSTSFAVNISWDNSSFLFPHRYIISITDFDIAFYGFGFDEEVVDEIKNVYFNFMKRRFDNYQKEYDLSRETKKKYAININ